ncbi:MAG TPA: Wzz/FepE/Etk N-terminal domain-containing protein, partial [Bryobacteraceae bacterium]|nr:Wzz/FepE/Etk N-terminal domain-containing protein [Bryobacteraceae bacterium]
MQNDPAQLPPAPGLVPRPPARDAVAPVQYLEASAYGYGPYQDQAEGAGALVEYWRIIRRGKWTLLLVAFVGALLSVLLTLPQTPVFQARATLEIQPLNEDFLNMRSMSPVQQSPVTDYTLGDIPTQVKILESATLLKRTSARLIAGRKPGAAPPKTDRVSAWRSVFKLREPKAVSPYEAALASAAGNVKIRSAGETRIVELLCDSTDPKLAADFVNTLTDEYIKQNLEVRWSMSERTGEWLSKQLDDMRIKLERSEDGLQAYARSAGLIFSSEGGAKLSEEQLRQVQTELGRAQADRVAQQSRFEIARSSPPEALADVLDNTSLRAYQAKLTELRQQLADAGSTFTPAHTKVKRLQAQVAEVESAFTRERNAI